MKINILFKTYFTSFITLLLFCFNSNGQEIDLSKYKILYKFNTVKQCDNTRILEVSFIARNKKNRKDLMPVFGAEINFINFLNEKEILLGSSKTSKKGIALLILPENQNYLTDKHGNINLAARFERTNALNEKVKEITVKDIELELNLTELDSVKMVLVNAFTLDSLNKKIPVGEVDIIIAIQGMLSKMKLEEGTIEDGKYEFEFPKDIPGDADGNLTVYSIIEDHEEFGNVNQKKTMKWGVFNKHSKKKENTLWSKAAPIWMYIVLTIMLVGVWANYLYTILNLFQLKKEGELLELNS
jgi:hypothetical protein